MSKKGLPFHLFDADSNLVTSNKFNTNLHMDQVMSFNKFNQLISFDEVSFTYDFLGQRVSKVGQKGEHTYKTHQGRILKETINQVSDITYNYLNNTLIGFTYNDNPYFYVRNALNDIAHIIDSNGTIKASYIYDSYGKHLIKNYDTDNLGDLNPFRYRGYYFDVETNLYYLQSRYYDPILARFISEDHLDYLEPESIGGLNLYAYCGGNPIMRVDPMGNAWWNWLISGIQLVVGIVLCATGAGAALGAGLIVGGALGIAANILEPKVARILGGAGSALNGQAAISTGISLFSFGPIGIIAGVVSIGIGAVTMAFGVNEVVAGITGNNRIQQITGMSDNLYGGLYIGFNIASSVATIAGGIGMKFASNRRLNSIIQNPSKVTNYKLWQMRTYGRYTSQYNVGVMGKSSSHPGGGYTLKNIKGEGYGYIQYHPGGGHHGPLAYWKVASHYNRAARFWYLSGLPF